MAVPCHRILRLRSVLDDLNGLTQSTDSIRLGGSRWTNRFRAWLEHALFVQPALAGELGPFSKLDGSWSGRGVIAMRDGSTESIHCAAGYVVEGSGNEMRELLVCASASYKVEISANVDCDHQRLTGSWAEATRHMSGNISGRASGSEISVNAASSGFTTRLTLR
jgi:hypothetical protein